MRIYADPLPARGLLGDGNLRPLFFCESCNNWKTLHIRTFVRHRYKNGKVFVDDEYVSDLRAFIGAYIEYVGDNLWDRGVYYTKDSKYVSPEITTYEHLAEDMENRFPRLYTPDLVMICPNCGSVMSQVEVFVNFDCCDLVNGSDVGRCPGCYVCQDLCDEEARDFAVKWCAYQYTHNYCGMNCFSCRQEYARIEHNITFHEIEVAAHKLYGGG